MSRPIETPGNRFGAAQRGFTLLEVLVALLCFALVFGILGQIIRTGLRQSASAETTMVASLLASSQLARVGVELPLEVGKFEGKVDDLRWQTAIQLVEPVTEETDISVYRIDVTVAWGEPEQDREVTLTTLKLGPPPDAGPGL
jgi:general secretion pathway protein I